MLERGRLVRPVLPIEEAYCKEATPFGHDLEVGGRAARAPASPTHTISTGGPPVPMAGRAYCLRRTPIRA